ncbi:unnamed protein product [Penicillium roqueforti FM164]|uniref:Aflatoxin regulatory protein domain-containing protein n=1 Tax=Penicillium roqueforti (strain FM164) TaxID=1365484 RepID=W6R9I0_PENRF|nr:unnamed protein product [Penicillium roqueforti FM164]
MPPPLHYHCDPKSPLTPHSRKQLLFLRNRRRSGGQSASGPEPARMSGSVLKNNKDAGMSVCRMLQCGCALRPQNPVLLALLCSRLVPSRLQSHMTD